MQSQSDYVTLVIVNHMTGIGMNADRALLACVNMAIKVKSFLFCTGAWKVTAVSWKGDYIRRTADSRHSGGTAVECECVCVCVCVCV